MMINVRAMIINRFREILCECDERVWEWEREGGPRDINKII